MIPFFRKIRKKLADDNKPLKYARYAIGEIVLVVIGILIALQVNNYNEKRKKRILHYLWNEDEHLFFDYDFVNRKQSEYVSATSFYPLWACDLKDLKVSGNRATLMIRVSNRIIIPKLSIHLLSQLKMGITT